MNEHDAWNSPAPGLSITIHNDMGELDRLAATVRAFLAFRGLSPEAEYAVDLSLKEIVTRIMTDTAAEAKCRAIDVRVRLLPPDICVQIEDDGHEFNPLAVPKPELDLGLAVEERPVANIGMHLVRTMAKSVDYFRSDAHNILRIVIDTGSHC